jgi:hypothetical protein
VVVNVTAAFAKACPPRLSRVTVMDVPARILPRKTESVRVAASAVHQNTLVLRVSPLVMTTEKLVPVRAPVPLVPILKIQVSLEDPSSVNTPPVSVAAALTQYTPGRSVWPERTVKSVPHGLAAMSAYASRKSS